MDLRDNRGKEHEIAVILMGLILAILSHRDGNLSSVQRHMKNHYALLLQEIQLDNYDYQVVSRSHLPIVLGKVSWKVFNQLIFANFGVKLNKKQRKWFAIDGKEMRGSIKKGEKRGEAVVQAVEQATGGIQSQNYYAGNKESEIENTRNLLKDNDLLGEGITLDALHCHPQTLEMIAEKGNYIVGLKDNQAKLKEAVSEAIATIEPIYEVETLEKQSGRVETRRYEIYEIGELEKAERWEKSQIKRAIRVIRERVELKTGKESREESLYLTNEANKVEEICQAIRKHWQVEVTNNMRDTTLAEDRLCVKEPTVNRVMGEVRTLVLSLLRLTGCRNKKAQLDDFADDFGSLIYWLKSIQFL